MKSEGGAKQWLMIRRFRCCRCRKLHNELPDCLTAFKHYKTEVIAGVVDGIVTLDDLDSENYPCVSTMLLWLRWFQLNLERMEGYLRMAAYELSDYNLQTLFAKVSLLDSLTGSTSFQAESLACSIGSVRRALCYAFQHQTRLIDDHMVSYVADHEMLATSE